MKSILGLSLLFMLAGCGEAKSIGQQTNVQYLIATNTDSAPVSDAEPIIIGSWGPDQTDTSIPAAYRINFGIDGGMKIFVAGGYAAKGTYRILEDHKKYFRIEVTEKKRTMSTPNGDLVETLSKTQFARIYFSNESIRIEVEPSGDVEVLPTGTAIRE